MGDPTAEKSPGQLRVEYIRHKYHQRLLDRASGLLDAYNQMIGAPIIAHLGHEDAVSRFYLLIEVGNVNLGHDLWFGRVWQFFEDALMDGRIPLVNVEMLCRSIPSLNWGAMSKAKVFFIFCDNSRVECMWQLCEFSQADLLTRDSPLNKQTVDEIVLVLATVNLAFDMRFPTLMRTHFEKTTGKKSVRAH